MLTVHGWSLLFYPAFLDQLERLIATVENEAAKGVLGASAKLLGAIDLLIYDQIPHDPADVRFRQGGTLGPSRKHWFRAKFSGGRFRLFFRFRTDARLIVYGWVNDAETLRTYGARTDAYAVFEQMLDRGDPPDGWDELVRKASAPEVLARTRNLSRRSRRDAEQKLPSAPLPFHRAE
ncbi:MAG TPA: type II toxin-antitoxin system YhaV family toxin [Longimicrobium sp.]|nr:type II toxin-antitoxin system YhaV family toxin [Longimicrobium sp.]